MNNLLQNSERNLSEQENTKSHGAQSGAGRPIGQRAMQTIAVERDANPGGSMFGGWVLAQMDMAGAAHAFGIAHQRIVTVSADKIRFHRPLIIGQEVELYTKTTHIGNSSIAVNVNVWHVKYNAENKEFFNIAEGIFTFVALDHDGRPDKTLRSRIDGAGE
jgi:acyl-CoA thioesterase YciA